MPHGINDVLIGASVFEQFKESLFDPGKTFKDSSAVEQTAGPAICL